MPGPVRKFFALAMAAIFMGLCLLPGVWLLGFDGTTQSLTENRELAGLPERPSSWQQTQEWPSQFDSFVADHFGGREELVRAYNLLHIKAGVSPIERALVGREGWLYLEQTYLGEANRGALPMDEAQMDALIDSFEQRRRYLEAQGRAFIVMPAPDKNSVFPEYLPRSLKKIGPSRFMQFLDAARAADIPMVDVLGALETAKNAGEAIYFKTDSHWNCRGAWFAYQELMRTLRENGYAGGTVLQESDMEFISPSPGYRTDIVNNLLNLYGLVEEPFSYLCRVRDAPEITAMNPADGTPLDYAYWPPPGREHRVYRRTQPRDHSRVLVYRDSYANAMLRFLVHSFDEVIYAAPAAHLGFDPEDVKKYDPDLVIYEFVERALFYPADNRLLMAESADGEGAGTNSRSPRN